jgi:hypothetical protein
MIENITHVLIAFWFINFVIAGLICLISFGYYNLTLDRVKNIFDVKNKLFKIKKIIYKT